MTVMLIVVAPVLERHTYMMFDDSVECFPIRFIISSKTLTVAFKTLQPGTTKRRIYQPCISFQGQARKQHGDHSTQNLPEPAQPRLTCRPRQPRPVLLPALPLGLSVPGSLPQGVRLAIYLA